MSFLGRFLLGFCLLLVEFEGTGGACPFGLDQGAFGHQALDGDLDTGIILLHIVTTGRKSVLQGCKGHTPLLRHGHSLDDEVADARACFLGLRR